MRRGTCDVCGRNNVILCRTMACGIETFACSGDCGEDPYGENESDEQDEGPRPMERFLRDSAAQDAETIAGCSANGSAEPGEAGAGGSNPPRSTKNNHPPQTGVKA